MARSKGRTKAVAPTPSAQDPVEKKPIEDSPVVSSGPQVGPADVVFDIDPDIPIEFLQKAAALSGKLPPNKASREKLVEMHLSYLGRQKTPQNAPRMVKKLILALAYPASPKAIKDLETVLSSVPLLSYKV
jgi:hypothetical protein